MPIQKTTPKEIIASSIRVFRKKGYYRTNMIDLAKEVGLTKGAFYHHFASKEDVMRASLQALSDWFDRRVFSIAYLPNYSSKEKLDQMTTVAYQAFTQEEGGCFFANTILETAHVEDSFIPVVNHFFSSWEKAFHQVFQDHHPKEELEELVQQIIADIEGSILLMQLRKDTSYLQKALERTKNKIPLPE